MHKKYLLHMLQISIPPKLHIKQKQNKCWLERTKDYSFPIELREHLIQYAQITHHILPYILFPAAQIEAQCDSNI